MDAISYTIIISAILILAWMAYYFLWLKKFVITVIVRELTGNGSMIIKFDKARTFIDSENTEKWQLWYEKGIILPPPPADAVEVTVRGRKFAELYKLGDYKYVWVVDNHTTQTIEDQMIKDEKTNISTGRLSTEQTWRPISASAKMAWLSQTRKSIAMRGKGLAEKLAELLPYAAIIIILFIGYLMWDSQNQANIKITESVSSAVSGMAAVGERMADATNRVVDLSEGKQTINPQPIKTNTTKVPN